jgi:regulator of sirC expression with transglutaminase-like and TPR domain
MNHLRHILEEDPAKGRLDRAALELATIQFPDLEPEPYLAQLNELASQLGDRLRNFNDGREFVETAQSFLFGEMGFHGNETDFFDPRNSCLNEVLARRTGIAITLSLLYMEVGRRLHMPLYGIGLPRHFVMQYDDGNYSTFIDPYGGKAISARDCFVLAGMQTFDPSILARVTKKQIVMRMLHNMRLVYLRTNDFERAVTTMDWLIVGYPEPAAFKSRGGLLLELKRYQAARRDLEKYLELEPNASDRPDIERSLEKIHQWLARVN